MRHVVVMSTIGIWLLSVGLATLSASAAGPIVERVTPKGRARRLARRLPRTRIADARAGDLVKIVGKVELDADSVVAPFSGRACAHYEAGVEVGARGAFRRRIEEQRTTSFVVADETGRAFIETDRILVDVVIDHLWAAADTDPETRFELERFLFQAGPTGNRLLADPARVRYVEGALEPGETVTVVGCATWGRATEPGVGYRDLTRSLLIDAPSRGVVFVSDGVHYA